MCPDDNNVEAVELPDKRFVMGVKWHPELMESMNPLFEEFVKACDARKIEHKSTSFTIQS